MRNIALRESHLRERLGFARISCDVLILNQINAKLLAMNETENQPSNYSVQQNASLAFPPGPKGHWLWGSLLDRKRNPLGFFRQMAGRYGDVSRFRFGPIWITHVAHPDLVKSVLFDNEVHFRKGKAYDLLRILLGNGLLTSEGFQWKSQRKLTQPVFHGKNLAPLVAVMSRCTQERMNTWKTGSMVDVSHELNQLTLNIVMTTLMGTSASKADMELIGKELTVALKCIDDIFFSLIPIPHGLPTPKTLRLRRATRAMETVVYRIIKDKKENGASGGARDLLTVMIDSADEDSGRRMTDLQLRDEIMTFLLAGHETTANALSWAWYLLSKHPDKLEKLQTEAKLVLGDKMPSMDSVSRLKYSTAVFEEALRIYPPIYILVRDVVKDCSLGGFKVKAGGFVSFSTLVLHKDPRWWKDPEDFIPERFLEGAPEFDENRPKFAYVPFSSGPRNCIGAPFALIEGALILSMMARDWDLKLVDGAVIEPKAAVTLRPKYGVPMTINKKN